MPAVPAAPRPAEQSVSLADLVSHRRKALQGSPNNPSALQARYLACLKDLDTKKGVALVQLNEWNRTHPLDTCADMYKLEDHMASYIKAGRADSEAAGKALAKFQEMKRDVYCCRPNCNKLAVAMPIPSYMEFLGSEYRSLLEVDACSLLFGKRMRFAWISAKHRSNRFPARDALPAGCHEHVPIDSGRVLLNPGNNRICVNCWSREARSGNYSIVVAGQESVDAPHIVCGTCNKCIPADVPIGEGERPVMRALHPIALAFGLEIFGQKSMFGSPALDVVVTYEREGYTVVHIIEVCTPRTHNCVTDVRKMLELYEASRSEESDYKIVYTTLMWVMQSGFESVDILRQHLVRELKYGNVPSMPSLQLQLIGMPSTDVAYIRRLVTKNIADPVSSAFEETCVHELTGVPAPIPRPGLEQLLANRDTRGRIEVTTVNHQFNLAPMDIHVGEGRGNRGARGTRMIKCLPRRVRDNEMALPLHPVFPPHTPLHPVFNMQAFSSDVSRN